MVQKEQHNVQYKREKEKEKKKKNRRKAFVSDELKLNLFLLELQYKPISKETQ